MLGRFFIILVNVYHYTGLVISYYFVILTSVLNYNDVCVLLLNKNDRYFLNKVVK